MALAAAWKRADCSAARERELARFDSHWQRTGRNTETEITILHGARAVYVSNPKVGSSFLGDFMRWLEADERAHRLPDQMNVVLPGAGRGGNLLTLDQAVPRHYRLFTFVREPLTRTLSAFGEIGRRAAYPLKNGTCEERSHRFRLFVEKMENGTFVHGRGSNCPWPQLMPRADTATARFCCARRFTTAPSTPGHRSCALQPPWAPIAPSLTLAALACSVRIWMRSLLCWASSASVCRPLTRSCASCNLVRVAPTTGKGLIARPLAQHCTRRKPLWTRPVFTSV